MRHDNEPMASALPTGAECRIPSPRGRGQGEIAPTQNDSRLEPLNHYGVGCATSAECHSPSPGGEGRGEGGLFRASLLALLFPVHGEGERDVPCLAASISFTSLEPVARCFESAPRTSLVPQGQNMNSRGRQPTVKQRGVFDPEGVAPFPPRRTYPSAWMRRTMPESPARSLPLFRAARRRGLGRGGAWENATVSEVLSHHLSPALSPIRMAERESVFGIVWVSGVFDTSPLSFTPSCL